MKKVFTLVVCSLLYVTGVAQEDLAGNGEHPLPNQIERTTAIEALFAEGQILSENGTAAEINANRLAIKAEWQQIDPEIAALYKPVDNGGALPETEENVGVNGVTYPNVLLEREELSTIPTRDWVDDRRLRNHWVDGVDMDVTGDGDIYISTYARYIDFGGTRDSISIFRSLDGGVSFEEWRKVAVTAAMRKLQIISFDGTGDEYLVAYLLTNSDNFQAWRWNTTTGAFDAQVISGDVNDFGVDRNYPAGTASQRAFASYQKDVLCETEVHSARSTAGSYGFDWIDEVSTSTVCGGQIELTYGINGTTYITFTGANTGNLYANVNDSFNDPTSWGTRETIVTGAATESLNPVIRAARKGLATDEVLIITSSRDAGTTDGYNHQSYIRENEGVYVGLVPGIPLPNESAGPMDSWVRKGNNTEVIRTSYIRDIVDNSSNDRCNSYTYDGTSMTSNERVSDTGTNVWDGFAAAVAETSDDMPCMAFAGTSPGGTAGFGLYFDSKAGILATEENSIEGLVYFPNPAMNELTINTVNQIDSVVFYNLLGQEVKRLHPSNNVVSVDVSSFTSGVYVMRVSSNGQTGSYKIIKQ